MIILVDILIAVFVVSLISFAGVLTLIFKKRFLEKLIPVLVSFAAGALIGGAFFHLLPESVESGGSPFLMCVFGIVLFYFIEIFLHWHHCHLDDSKCDLKKDKKKIKPVGFLNLFGDGVHNFVDGIIIGAAFLIDLNLGIVTTIAVALHEIPQELGDFGILLHSGFSAGKALFFNFLSALTAVLGALSVFFFESFFQGMTVHLIPFAAGGFIYIALADLVAEHKHECNFKKANLQFFIFLIGLALMFFSKYFLH